MEAGRVLAHLGDGQRLYAGNDVREVGFPGGRLPAVPLGLGSAGAAAALEEQRRSGAIRTEGRMRQRASAARAALHRDGHVGLEMKKPAGEPYGLGGLDVAATYTAW